MNEEKMDRLNWFDGQWCRKCKNIFVESDQKPCVECIYLEDKPSEFVER